MQKDPDHSCTLESSHSLTLIHLLRSLVHLLLSLLGLLGESDVLDILIVASRKGDLQVSHVALSLRGKVLSDDRNTLQSALFSSHSFFFTSS